MHTTTYLLVQSQVATSGEESSGGAGALFKLDPGLIIWTWIVFCALLLLLSKFGLKPLLAAVGQRERKIADAVAQAEQAGRALAEADLQRQAIITEAREQAETIIIGARKQAQEEARLIVEDARKMSRQIAQDGQQQIAHEKRKALEELKERIIEMIIGGSANLVARKFDARAHRDTVEEYLGQL
jgi:F-type H+-transporting ATPase subunit b